MISALLLIASANAAAPSAPVPGEVKVFKDWYVACDNVWHCEAGSLAQEDGDFSGAQAVRIWREGGPKAALRIALRPGDEMAAGPARLKIDALAPLVGRLDKQGDTLFGSGQSLAIARALANGKSAALILADGSTLPLSLSGSSAALRYIDAVQRRAGTSGAIIATGAKADTALPPPAPRLIARTASRPSRLPDMKDYPEIIAKTGCENRMEGIDDTVHPLGQQGGKDMALALIACDSGAYNFGSVVMIAERPTANPKARWTFRPAAFDSEIGWAYDDQPAQLINAGYTPETGQLSEFSKGRGLGDCGTASSYVWDGERFRLSERYAMDDCRGAWDWPRVWTTELAVVR